MNRATEIMLEWSIKFFLDGIGYDDDFKFSGEGLKEDWEDDIYNHSDEYDNEYFQLVATPNIAKTIDWNWIANELTKKIPDYK